MSDKITISYSAAETRQVLATGRLLSQYRPKRVAPGSRPRQYLSSTPMDQIEMTTDESAHELVGNYLSLRRGCPFDDELRNERAKVAWLVSG